MRDMKALIYDILRSISSEFVETTTTKKSWLECKNDGEYSSQCGYYFQIMSCTAGLRWKAAVHNAEQDLRHTALCMGQEAHLFSTTWKLKVQFMDDWLQQLLFSSLRAIHFLTNNPTTKSKKKIKEFPNSFFIMRTEGWKTENYILLWTSNSHTWKNITMPTGATDHLYQLTQEQLNWKGFKSTSLHRCSPNLDAKCQFGGDHDGTLSLPRGLYDEVLNSPPPPPCPWS